MRLKRRNVERTLQLRSYIGTAAESAPGSVKSADPPTPRGRRAAGRSRYRATTVALALLVASGGTWGCAAMNPPMDIETTLAGSRAHLTAVPGPPRVEVSLTAVSRPPRMEVGLASWYGAYHQGLLTASGEIYDMDGLTAAHRTLPLGTRLRVTNLDNGRVVRVRVNDRGPYVPGRVLDLSRRAARLLDMVERGVVLVRLEVDRA